MKNMDYREMPTREAIRGTIAWLKLELGYEFDDLPHGFKQDGENCPVANAIKTTRLFDSPNVDKGVIVYWLGEVQYIRALPPAIKAFINRFDVGEGYYLLDEGINRDFGLPYPDDGADEDEGLL